MKRDIKALTDEIAMLACFALFPALALYNPEKVAWFMWPFVAFSAFMVLVTLGNVDTIWHGRHKLPEDRT